MLLVLLKFLSENINLPNGQIILFRHVQFFGGSWDYVIADHSIISAEILAHDIGDDHDEGGNEFGVYEIFRLDAWFN